MSLTPQIKRYIAKQIAESLGASGDSPSLWVTANGNLYYTGGFVGIGTDVPAYALDVAGSTNIATGSTYRIGGTTVLSATALGTGVVSSSLTSVGTIGTGIWQGTAIANAYIATGLDVTKLTVGTTLPSNVVSSSLTSVGTLTSGAIGSGFTAIPNSALANSAITINGTPVSLGGSISISTSIDAGTLTGTTLASNVVNSSLTSLGTLSSLSVTGSITAGSVTASLVDATNLEVVNIRTQDGDLAIAIGDADAFLLESGDKILLEDDSGFLMATSVRFMVNGLNASQAVFTNSATELVSNAITGTGNVVMSASPTLTGTVQVANLTASGTITGTLSGNASTATTLQTTRNINGVSFNGSADITVTAAAGTLSGSTLASGVTASSLTSVGTLTALTVSGTATGGKFVPTANTVTGNGMYLPATDAVAISTAGVEHIRVNANGFLKVANDGAYYSSTEGPHEMRHSNVSGAVLTVDSSHTSISTSYSGIILQVTSARSSGTNFSFIQCYSSGVGGTEQFRVRGDGVIYAQNTTVQSISDARLKENITDATDGLNVISALRPVRYDWKAGYGNDRTNQLGFIAQEVEAVFPEAVSEWAMNEPTGEMDEDGKPITEKVDYKTVGPGALIPVLVKAIQELHAEVTSLREQLL